MGIPALRLPDSPAKHVSAPGWLTRALHNDRLLYALTVAVAIGATSLLVLGENALGLDILVSLLAALSALVAVMFRPIAGLYCLVGAVILVEQENIATPILTDQLYIFHWTPQLEGLFERPLGFFLLVLFLVVIGRNLAHRRPLLQGGALLLPFLAFLLCIAVGVAHGLASGGTFRIIVLEIRPFVYLFESYLLAYNLVTRVQHVRTILWIVIIGTGVKSLQGVYLIVVALHGHLSGQNEIMAHEQSFFFVALLLLVVIFCLHHAYRPQLYVALLFVPTTLLALIANNRRADYFALLVGILVAWLLVAIVKPQVRTRLVTALCICLLLGTSYVLLFSHTGGALGKPARSVISVVSPDPTDVRDAASNQYRIDEELDLRATLKLNPLLGFGFGKQFLQPITLPNIIDLDPYYLYVPHNTLYWVWMRLGLVGFAAFWYLIGSLLVRGILILRELQDLYLQMTAILCIALVVMEVIVAYADYQLFKYRTIIFLGVLAGILLKLPSVDATSQQEQQGHREDREHERGHQVKEVALR
jgi:hypothetical protein